MHGYGILIEGLNVEGENNKRERSEIHPVFKYLREPENYMPILVNMMLDMIGCYQFPDLRHESEQMKARRRFLTNEACEEMFGDYRRKDENKYYALENNYYIFKETCVVASCSAILGRDKKLHDYCMKVYDAAAFGFQNEDTERNKRIAYEHGMQFVPYLQYFISKHLSDTNITRTARLGACFWKVVSYVCPDAFPEHDESVERFMYSGKLPEILPVLKESQELMMCANLPEVLSIIYDTLEDYFMVLCPEAVSPRPPAYEKLEGLGDYLFGDSCIKLGIRPFSEFKKEYEEAEKIKRSNEYKAYDIVKEILSSVITTNRLSLRMAQRHSSVLLDNKVNMAICRFYFMRKQKYMLIIDVKREQEKLLVNDVKDIYNYADKLRSIITAYEYMTDLEAAQILKLSYFMIRKLCIRGKIDGAQKVGSMWIMPRTAVKELLYKKRHVMVQKKR